MQRGQISIDLIIALIVVIMAAGSMATVLDGYRAGQDKILLENQVRMESLRLSNFITASQAMSDINFYAVEPISKISYKGNLFYPEIIIRNDLNTITVRAIANDMNVDANFGFSRQSSMTPELDLVNNFLVVRNAR